MDCETDQELLHRFQHVNSLFNKTVKQLNKMKPGANRDRKARFGGSLQFSLLQLKSEIEDRNLNNGQNC